MCSCARKGNDIPCNSVDKKKVAAYVAFPILAPGTAQRMVSPFRSQRRVTSNQEQHAHRARHGGPLILCHSFQDLRTVARPL